MANLNINGRTVTVDDSFLQMTPDQQNAAVEEIAGSLPSEKGTLQTARENMDKGQKSIMRGVIGGGVLGLPALAGDAILNAGSGLNYLSRKAASAITGDKSVERPAAEMFGMPLSRTAGKITDAAVEGMPDFESPSGKIAGKVIEGVSGGAGAVAVGKAIPGAIGRFLSAQPKTQMAAGGTAGGVSEIIKQAGGDDVTATVAGTGTGVATALTLSALSRGRASPRVNALDRRGQAAIADDILKREATDPAAAAARAANAPEFIPGARPLGTTATADPGLITAGKKLERFAGDTAEREVANNAARATAVERQGLRPGAFDRIDRRLDDLTNNLPRQTFANETPVNIDGLIQRFRALTDPYTHTEATIARANQALRFLDNPAFQTPNGAQMMPSDLYNLGRKQIAALTRPGSGAEDGLVADARRRISEIMPEIDNVITQGAPQFERAYLRPYRNLRNQRDQIEYLQTLRDRATNDGLDGARQWSPAKYLGMRSESKRGAPVVTQNPNNRIREQDLSPRRQNLLARLDQDMRRENSVNIRGAKPSNSVTAESIDYGKGIDEMVKSNLPILARGRLAAANGIEGMRTTMGVGGFMGGGAPGAVAGAAVGSVLPRILRGNLERRAMEAAQGVRSELGAAYTDPARMAAGLTSPALSRGARGPRGGDGVRGAYQGFMGSGGGRIEERKKRSRYR